MGCVPTRQPPPWEDTFRSCPMGGLPSRGHVVHGAPKGMTGWLCDQHSSASDQALRALRRVMAGPEDNQLPFLTTHSLSWVGAGGQSCPPAPTHT